MIVTRARGMRMPARAWPVVLGLVAMAVSAPGIGIPSKWSDEAATTSAANRSVADLWALVNNIDAVHGLYYLSMHGWIGVFGDSAIAMRIPSMLAVGIAAAGVAVLGRMLGGDRLMIAAALCFAVLPRVTWAAIEARSYAGTIALAAWGTVCFVHTLRHWSVRGWLLYAVTVAVAIALNIDLALLLVAHGITLLLSWRTLARAARSLFWFLGAGIAAVAITVPLVLLAIRQSEQVSISALTPGYIANMLGIAQYFSGATPVRDRLIPIPPDTVWAWGAVLLAVVGWMLIVVGALSRKSRHPLSVVSLVSVAVPWIAAPSLLLIAYSALGDNIFTARYLSFTTPAAALLIGAGILALRSRARIIAVTVLIVALAFPVYFFQRVPTGKQGTDWAQAAQIVDAAKQPGDVVYWGQQYGSPSAAYTISRIGYAYPDEFAGLDSVTATATAAETGSLWGPDRLLEQSADRIDPATRVWAISDHLGDPSAHPERGGEWLAANGFTLQQQWNGEATDVFLWVRQ